MAAAVCEGHRDIDAVLSRSARFDLVNRAETNGELYWCRLNRGGASIMLQQASAEDTPPEGRGRGVVFYFVCDDADAMYEELTARGLKVEPPAVSYYGMKQVFVPEPDGYDICFESETTSPAQ
jgi:uncharacterized glyoxalase superfamily protein PhnB